MQSAACRLQWVLWGVLTLGQAWEWERDREARPTAGLLSALWWPWGLWLPSGLSQDYF